MSLTASSGSGDSQTLIQVNLYRYRYGHFEYLLFRRNDPADPFWQPVTEVVRAGSDIGQTVKRAAFEQAGLQSFKHFDKEMYSYEWFTGRERGRDIVFAAEVAEGAAVNADTKRYSTFAWLPYQEALLRLKWDGNKQALRQLDERLEARRVSDPDYWQSREQGLYNQAASSSSQAPGAAATGSPGSNTGNPYSDQVPKRLPDQPEAKRANGGEVNTSEWFL